MNKVTCKCILYGIIKITRRIVFLWFLFVIVMFPVLALANHFVELCTRLSLVNSFYVRFTQKIIDSTGVVLQEHCGELWVQRPNFFNYHILFPEESSLISNGTILWFYDPSLNQVVVRWLKDVVDNVFFILLSDDLEKLNWDDYYFINKDGDTFYLFLKECQNTILEKVEITITNQGIIEKFKILNKDNQCVDYQFTQHNISTFGMDKFNFSPPNGVIVDEQR